MTTIGKQGSQRTSEWDVIDARALDYHMKQWEDPKRSTIAFERFVAPELTSAGKIVDLGCGAGAATAYVARLHQAQEFLGIDISAELVAIGARLAREKGLANLSFEADDWYALREYPGIDGVMSMQSLSWLPDSERPMEAIFTRLRPRWVALSSLFYDGRISCRIEVEEHTRGRKTFYNVYSLPVFDEFCATHGYRVRRHEPFRLDIDIPKPADADLMSTYTLKTEAGGAASERLQISGPLLLNWAFVLLERQG